MRDSHEREGAPHLAAHNAVRDHRMNNSAPAHPATPGKRFLSRREVAELFDVSAHTVYRWTREGRLPYIMTPGGRRRYPREEIERLASGWLRVRRSGEAAPDEA